MSNQKTEYDRAIAALAPYLADGWITQDGDEGEGTVVSFTPAKGRFPTIHTDEEDGAQFWNADPSSDGIFNLPPCEDWKTSLREIKGGKVVAP